MAIQTVKRLIVCAAVCIAPVAWAGSEAPTDLPDIGDFGAALLSTEQEQALGQEFMHDVRRLLDLANDPLIDAYIQGLGDRLTSHRSTKGQGATFFTVRDPTINAFAGPGGYIGVHTGLILSAASEDELASVLAHEIAHVHQRHLVRTLVTDNRQGLMTLASIVAAALLSSHGGQGTEAVLMSAMANSADQQLQFSRAHEQEADRLGLSMLAESGFEPREMPNFFEKLYKADRYAPLAPEFLLTHPLTPGRIADTRNRANQYPTAATQADDTAFRLIQARVRYLTRDKSHPPTAAATASPSATATPPERYAHALILQGIGRFEEAGNIVSALLTSDQKRLIYYTSLAEIQRDAGRLDSALGTLDQGATIYPNNTALVQLWGATLLEAQRAEPARALLANQLRSYPPHPDLYRLLARAAGEAGRLGEAYEAQAHYFNLMGQAHEAIDQLQRALQQQDTDPYAKIRRGALLEQWKAAAPAATPTPTPQHL